MARTKKSETNTTSVVDEKVQEQEKTTEVETNTPVETETTKVEESKPVDEKVQEQEKTVSKPTETKAKKFGDNDKVIIKCAAYAGKSIVLPTRTIELDENGKCEVTGVEANRLLTIPGYELAK